MITRRKFFGILAMAAGALAWPASWLAAKSTIVTFSLDKAAKLKNLGGWTILNIKKHKILFVRDSDKTIRALDSVCTHKGCAVVYNAKTKQVECPCHGSAFDLTGKLIKGPAKKPLPLYQAVLEGDKINVTIEE